jgi:hypothetical protein
MSGNPKRKEKGIEEKKIAERLRDATHLIHKQSEHAGLNDRFKEEIIKANEAAVALCEKAMENLSTVYIESLADFKAANDALRALSHLETSEEVWRKGTDVIERYDQDGGEILFLRKMRTMASEVLENKLRFAESQSTSCPENDALCLGILGVMDSMLSDLGFPKECEERALLKEKANKIQ